MKILLLGGPRFLGLHLIDAALARDHQVTLFNRGKTDPDLYPDLEKLRGDRDGDLDSIRERISARGGWDAAIDTSGYLPRVVRASTELLSDAVDHYTFISSISVYADPAQRNDETSPVSTLEDESVEEITGETYGPLKALCEQAAEVAMPGRVFNVRPGLIVGPYDPTDRFTYWAARVSRGGEVLAPDSPDVPVQLIDARDLAEWIVRMAEARTIGIYNATGPETPLAFGEALEACRRVSGSDAKFTWANESFLLEEGVQPWMEMPMWLPADLQNMMRTRVDKAVEAGLSFRPLDETVSDTLAWNEARFEGESVLEAGLTREREAELLERWQAVG